MSTKKRGLGKGLSDIGLTELLSRTHVEEKKPTQTQSEFRQIKTGLLQPGKYQPRKEIDTQGLEELSESIRSQGIIQPIVVRPLDDHQYEIIAGERRWRAAQLAGLEEVPVVVRDIPDEAAVAVALIENIQRENLNAIEEATALQRLIDEFAMTHQEVAKVVGKSRATISNLLRLLALNPEVKNLVEKGLLEMGHARALLTLSTEKQIQVAGVVVGKNLSVRETEEYMRRLQNLTEGERSDKDAYIVQTEKALGKKLGVRVRIKQASNGRGKIVFSYRHQDQLTKLIELFEVMNT